MLRHSVLSMWHWGMQRALHQTSSLAEQGLTGGDVPAQGCAPEPAQARHGSPQRPGSAAQLPELLIGLRPAPAWLLG